MRRFFLKLSRRRRLQHDLETELAFHRDMSRDSHNFIPLGNAAVITESALDLWRFTFIENLWRDLVYAARSLMHSRGRPEEPGLLQMERGYSGVLQNHGNSHAPRAHLRAPGSW